MKKTIWMGVIAALVVAAVAFAGVSYVNAQAPTPRVPGSGAGYGWMMGGQQSMAEYMHEALAEKLGISEEEFEDQLAQGMTAWEIAEAEGISQEDFLTLMTEARDAALDQMVADGALTQEQADWMKERSGAMMGGVGGYGLGRGGCPMFDDGTTTGTTARGGRGRGMIPSSGMMGGGSW